MLWSSLESKTMRSTYSKFSRMIRILDLNVLRWNLQIDPTQIITSKTTVPKRCLKSRKSFLCFGFYLAFGSLYFKV